MVSVTELLRADRPKDVARAVAHIAGGEPVVFPTDTVYGIGVDAFQASAIERLYQVKQRPATKGIPILLSDLSCLKRVATDIPPLAREMIAQFWPGALTIIVPRHPLLPLNLSPNANVAARIPDSGIARAFIRLAGGALATSSANITGQAAAVTASDAYATFRGLIPAVLDGGPASYGRRSTILDCTVQPPQILRQGAVPVEAISL